MVLQEEYLTSIKKGIENLNQTEFNNLIENLKKIHEENKPKHFVKIENYLTSLKKVLDDINPKELGEIIDILKKAYDNNRTVFIIGNGGSASTASHFACDLGKTPMGEHYNSDKKRFIVNSLTDNCATLTAIGNDLSYDEIFYQQLRNLASKEDILISISASGNSPNILKAIDFGNSIGMTTIGFIGFDGGKAAEKILHKIHIKNHQYGIVEDTHLIIEHMICEVLKEKLSSK